MHAVCLTTLLAAAVSMSRGEFVDVQKLGPDDLRARFGLPSSCDPSVVALSTAPAREGILGSQHHDGRPAQAHD